MITYSDFNINLFPVKVFSTLIDTIDCVKLRDECLEYKKKCSGTRISNEGGWQSVSIKPEHVSADLYSEFKKLLLLIEKYLCSLSQSLYANKLCISNAWININGYNDFNWPHAHDGSIFSGVFYVNVPQDSLSSLVFISPYENCSGWFDYFSNSTLEDYSTASHTYFEPRAGALILFPSYAKHKVTPNKSQKERISIAFNTVCFN